jgi:hypothetical protein
MIFARLGFGLCSGSGPTILVPGTACEELVCQVMSADPANLLVQFYRSAIFEVYSSVKKKGNYA